MNAIKDLNRETAKAGDTFKAGHSQGEAAAQETPNAGMSSPRVQPNPITPGAKAGTFPNPTGPGGK